LPQTEGIPNELVIQRPHLTSYSRAVRAAGARLIEVGYLGYPGQGTVWPWQIEAAITAQTVGLVYTVSNTLGSVSLDRVIEIARSHSLPVIVDAAAALPPVGNLRAFIDAGADLVVFSGGKAIGGPQASGILVGKAELIESAALQHQDMDVLPATWSERDRYLRNQRLPGPPHHGIGRSMKVGKEETAGLVVALRRFLSIDLDEKRRDDVRQLTAIVDGLNGLPGIEAKLLLDQQAPRPYATAIMRIDEDAVGWSVESLINALAEGSPPIAVSHNFIHERAIGFIAASLREGEERVVLSRLLEMLAPKR
jgi:D-glucosaminate-6-phosphate ammonia-lyase